MFRELEDRLDHEWELSSFMETLRSLLKFFTHCRFEIDSEYDGGEFVSTIVSLDASQTAAATLSWPGDETPAIAEQSMKGQVQSFSPDEVTMSRG